MMHNTCTSYGSILSLRRRNLGFNSCNYPNERCPSICYCNCCSKFNVDASRLMHISLNPSLLYGFRQSSLIQCPPSRRVVLGSNDWYCNRSSIYDVGCSCCCSCGGSCSFSAGVVGRSCMEKCCVGMKKSVGGDRNLGRGFRERCCVNEKKSNGVDEIRGRIFKGERDCRCNVLGVGVKESNGNGVDKIRGGLSKDKRDFRCNALGVGVGERKVKGNSVDKTRGRMTRHECDFRCDALGDAEAMLSLLSEEEMEECLLARERKKSSCKDTRIKEQNVSSKECMDVKVSSSALSGSGYLESKYRKKRVESSVIYFREDGHEMRSKRESVMIDGDQRLRRRESCSSYYSLSDSTEFGSESEIDVKEKRVVGESSTSQGKELRKTEGVIISEVTQDELKSYEDEKNQQLISSRRDNVKVGGSSEWDWRKKSENKLTDDSSEVTESMKESIMRQSKLCQVNESSSMMALSSNKQIINQGNEFTLDLSSPRQSRSNIQKDDTVSEHATTDLEFHEHSKSHFKSDSQFSEVSISSSQHEQSTSGTSCLGQLKSQISVDKQESSYLKSSQQQESSSDKNRQIVETTKTTSRRPIEEKVETVIPHSVQETECEYCRTCRQSVKENIIKFDIQQHSELSDIRSDAKWTTSVQSQSESGHKKQEMDTSSFEAIVEDSQHRDELHLTTENVDARKIYGQYEMSNSDYSYDQSTRAEMRMTNLKGNSQDVKKLQGVSGGRFVKETESHKLLQSEMEASQVSPASVEINRHTVRDKQIYKQQTYLTSNFKVVKELVEKHDTVDRIRGQQVGEVEAESDLQLVVMPPSYSLLQHSPSDTDLASSIVRESSRRATGVDTGSGYSKAQATTPTFTGEFSSEDAINSAQRMQESSTQIVGEFVDKMSHESSASGTRTEKESSQLNNEINTLTGFTQSQAEKAGFSKQDSSPISGGSGTSVEETSQLESSESAVSRRTGKSMWNIVSGIFRLQWGSSESRKSSKKSSSNDSANDEIWFSGNEQYDGTDDSATRKQIGMLQEPSSPNQTAIGTVTSSQQEDHKKDEPITITQGPTSEQPIYRKGASRSQKKDCSKKEKGSNSREPSLDQSLPRVSDISQKGDSRSASLDILSSPIALHVGLVSEGVSIRENTDLNMAQRTSVSSPPGSSTTSASQFKRSNVFEEIEEVEKIEAHISSSPQDLLVSYARRLSRSDDFEETEEGGRNEEVISSISEFKGTSEVTQSDIPTSEETDAELKRRKLQRSKQVIPDGYDDWEDAYKRENEQRKVDEIFMREALGEAIKAAGSWEVPVGAVLVQNGKIIARGYNLVEELRDSTAHAEMICIREGSNILRTWRLSETTLYVTLEPCPMCAGAILQARIKTLVWGAPNKLLGADGSWIRLFPEEVEGDQRLEVADKPAAPAHPFHPKMNIRRGILESECTQIMQQFFQLRRKTEKEKEKKSEEAGQPSCLPGSHKPTKLLRKIHGVFHIT